jgi:hypothetical protein
MVYSDKKPQHTLKFQVLAWDRNNKVAELNRIVESQSSPLNNWISNGNSGICNLLGSNIFSQGNNKTI